MTEISDQAVWAVCDGLTNNYMECGIPCRKCVAVPPTEKQPGVMPVCRHKAEYAIRVVQEAIKPDLPPGWVRGP